MRGTVTVSTDGMTGRQCAAAATFLAAVARGDWGDLSVKLARYEGTGAEWPEPLSVAWWALSREFAREAARPRPGRHRAGARA